MENKKKENISKMKSTKIVFFILFLIIIAIGTSSGVFFYLKSKNNTNNAQNAAIYYAVFDDGTYYIPKAEPDIKFAIDGGDLNSYKLTNSNNETVESSIVEYNGKKYIQANKKYTKGETYQLELYTANFADDVLKEVKKIEFKIKENQKSEYKMADDVVTVDNKNIQIEDETKLKIQNENLKEGQVILVKDGDNINNAYKISNIDGEIATVVKPELSEIYNSVDLYKEGKVDFNNLKINENAEVEIEKSIKESALYKFLATEVYAAVEDPKISLVTDGEEIGIEIELKFKADGEKKLGLDSLKQHDLVIKVSYKISTDYIVDVEKDFSMNYDMAVKTKTEIEVELESGNEYLKGISDISDEEYSKSVQEIVQKLQKEVPDVSENSIDIGAIEVPTGIPGINVYFDIYFQTQLSLQINLKYTGQIETVQHAGFVMNKNEKKAYQNASQTTSSQEISVVGKAEIKIGIGLDGGISIINKDLAHAGVGLEFGAYNEYFATAKFKYTKETNDIDSGISAKIELGIYLKVKLDCSVDALFFKAEYKVDLKEIKYPVFKIESEVDWTDDEKEQDTTNTQQNIQQNSTTVNNSSSSSNSNNSNVQVNTGTENGVVGSLSVDTDSEVIKAYKKYILEQKYINDYKEHLQGLNSNTLQNVGYCIFDINKDGIPELIIDCVAGGVTEEWKTDAIYTYNQSSKTVVKVKLIYNYAGIRYEKNEKEIVYSETRPNTVTGIYGFYKLNNNNLVESKVVGHDRGSYNVYDGTYEYDSHMVWNANGQKTDITEEQERAYFNNVINFSYQDITKVK
ncbi:MAG: hypothetical protein IJE05_03315 [Clostridia bacterium]|nr:hypothetical protein [Clostridia bacterium]